MVRMAKENRDWGYLRIRGALSNLGHELARSTIADILQRNGMEPGADRGRRLLYRGGLDPKGLQRFMVLFFIKLSTRRIQIDGISASINGLWMSQIARNLTDTADGLLRGKCYLIHDRDPLFTAEFVSTLAGAGTQIRKASATRPEPELLRRKVCAYHRRSAAWKR